MSTMTPVEDTTIRTGEASPTTSVDAPDRGRSFRVVAVVLAIAIATVGAWVVYDLMTDSAPPAEIEQVIDEYLRAWTERDESALRAVTVDDFQLTEYVYKWDTADLDEVITYDAHEIVTRVFEGEWRIERGSMAVAGDGPWFVSLSETWNKCVFRDAGTCRRESAYVGGAVYVVVGELSSPEIAGHVWAGMLSRENQ